ncbi:MAG: hypothetical protein M0Z68_12775 [Gammaproteobacteria bacterium]|jgi:hypothetical protein|nr:hypothetical protein [Gammaproteobacteria bacterium]
MANPLPQCRSSADPAQVRQPLYLTARRRSVVDSDGRSLWVSPTTGPVARFPLSRLSRVVARGVLQWRQAALVALIRADIPLVVLAKDEPLAVLSPMPRLPHPCGTRLEEIVCQPGWEVRYQNWLRSARMRVLTAWSQAQESAATPVSEETFRALVRACVYQHPETAFSSGLVRGALAAIASRCLSRAGLQLSYWGFGGSLLDLAADLTGLLDIALSLECGAWMAQAHGNDEALLSLVYPAIDEVAKLAPQLLGHFGRWVQETADSWPSI